ncbi:hypothetical protein Phum_PHUM581900 [Pediculus humanus corporis]|uniref:Uncharacterized protein n=1 Tax=Pediculus humanus subsp. corporis TaxID=121224 RepID=E0W1R3_PEDHC|nr:uncharacterized protein Phum_PHUM581900 [Pediculus humanus corporis]EEB19645.1 hypothetical protein Phum_PHUM581900 [Pediculus humanus corporis]
MEKLRERSISRVSNESRRILCENSQNKLSPEFQSVLSPDSRKFLENQGKISPEVTRRRRIIFGQKSFAFAHDGELVEVDSTKDQKSKSNTLSPNDPNEKTQETDPEKLLKLRRCSLQKQKKVEEDSDEEEEEQNVVDASENEVFGSDSKNCSRKSNNKIPRRFLSSSSLKTLEIESNISKIMRREVEMEIKSLTQKIKHISDRDLVSVLTQEKNLSPWRYKIDLTKRETLVKS